MMITRTSSSTVAESPPSKQGFPCAYDKLLLDGTYRLSWCQEENYVHVLMQAKTLGWVGVGFGASDKVAGYVAENGSVITEDFYGAFPLTSQTRDSALTDGTDDVLSLKGWEENGWTNIQFSRSLNTGDPNDARLDQSSLINFVVAYGDKDQLPDVHTHQTEFVASKYSSLNTYSKATGKFSYDNNSTRRYSIILLCTRIPSHQRLWEQQKQSHLGYDRRYLHVEE